MTLELRFVGYERDIVNFLGSDENLWSWAPSLSICEAGPPLFTFVELGPLCTFVKLGTYLHLWSWVPLFTFVKLGTYLYLWSWVPSVHL